jgi:hypothetical protein
LQDSAYQIDVTGYSSGVEKRISADIQNNATLGAQLLTPPNFAIQSTHSICKSLIINSANDLYENIPGAPVNLPGDFSGYVPTGQTNLDSSGSVPVDFCNPI